MTLRLREGRIEDAEPCGRICWDAFRNIAAQHNFPADIPSAEAGIAVVGMMLRHPRFYAIVAELDGRVVGSNFADERSAIVGVGPITVAPDVQDRAVGRELMSNVFDRQAARGTPGTRLVQLAYNTRSLSLYTKLGFDTREPLSVMQGTPPAVRLPGRAVRTAVRGDLAACNRLCFTVHGHHRGGEVEESIAHGTATVVERDGSITGYATLIGWMGHAVAETNGDLEALIAAAPSYPGLGFLVPTRNGELLRWCLAHGLRLVVNANLMTIGLYNEPRAAWLPSVLY
ncbi:MAG: N-acetyltransferase family protein [Candidatus Binatia bacterium]